MRCKLLRRYSSHRHTLHTYKIASRGPVPDMVGYGWWWLGGGEGGCDDTESRAVPDRHRMQAAVPHRTALSQSSAILNPLTVHYCHNKSPWDCINPHEHSKHA